MVVAALHNRGHNDLRIFLLSHARQLFEKGNRCPELIVSMIAPGRHTTHLDAIFSVPRRMFGGSSRPGGTEISLACAWIERIRAISISQSVTGQCRSVAPI